MRAEKAAQAAACFVTPLRPSPVKRDHTCLPRPSFEALFRAHARYITGVLRRLGVRDPDREDLTHDVFVRVHGHLGKYDPARPARSWLFGIAARVARAHRRRAGYQLEIFRDRIEITDPTRLADEQLDLHRRRQIALRGIEAVAPDRRAVFVRHDIEGQTIPDITETLSIPLSTGYSRLRLARAEFASVVGPMLGERAPRRLSV